MSWPVLALGYPQGSWPWTPQNDNRQLARSARTEACLRWSHPTRWLRASHAWVSRLDGLGEYEWHLEP